MATGIQTFLEFERDASDADVWNRLGRELPAWSHSKIMAPISADEALYRCRLELDPVRPVEDSRRKSARGAIRLILEDVYLESITSDPITRV
jgi:hypothetical protein